MPLRNYRAILVVLAAASCAVSTPVDNTRQGNHIIASASRLNPSPADPAIRRDGAHHGSSHGATSFSSHSGGGSSYASAPSASGHGGGFGGSGFGGSGHSGFSGSGSGFSGSGFSGSGGYGDSNHIGDSGYGASQSYAAPQKPVGYFYYYYPVTVEEDKKEDEGFFDKMKKLFEPMMYPWNAMMDYFGYGEDYDYDDYDYDSYSQYARSFASRASDYMPWDSINEVGNYVTQDHCLEFYVCELGSYGRQYRSLHFLLDYILPSAESNPYTRSLKESVLNETDCYETYKCPIVRRRYITAQNSNTIDKKE